MDGKKTRCAWCGGDALYQRYHDREWGRPPIKHGRLDDVRLFEKICLEGFQSGLSWLTILKKRENFRAGFAGFDFNEVALFDDADIERLMGDSGIVRHRGKIVSTINNARRAVEMVEAEGSLGAFLLRYRPPPEERPHRITMKTIPNDTPTSAALSKELKRRGWSFVGPTTAYATMQAMGLVNDHAHDCDWRAEVEADQAALTS